MIVKESIQHFERGIDPKSALKIGLVSKIESFIEDLQKNKIHLRYIVRNSRQTHDRIESILEIDYKWDTNGTIAEIHMSSVKAGIDFKNVFELVSKPDYQIELKIKPEYFDLFDQAWKNYHGLD